MVTYAWAQDEDNQEGDTRSQPEVAPAPDTLGPGPKVKLIKEIFVPPISYASGNQVWSLAVDDMNQDGHPDVVTVTKRDNRIHIHYNNGTGNFSRVKSFPGPANGRSICTFDANGDEAPDIAAIGITGGLHIFLNNGQGLPRRPQTFPLSGMPHDLVSVDKDGDGDQDLAVVAVHQPKILWFRNEGQGRFKAVPAFKCGKNPRSLLAGDFNGDGYEDLVAGCDDGNLYFYYSQSGGGLSATRARLNATENNWGVAAGDFNNDGKLDIAAGCYINHDVSVHLNQGDHQWSRQDLHSGDHNFDLFVNDLDRDGDLDLVSASTLDNSLHIHLNDGKGVFTHGTSLGSGRWNAGVTGADVDQDGDTDIISGSINDGKINVHQNRIFQNTFVNGYITDKDTGEPLQAATVMLMDRANRVIDSLETDEKGYYKKVMPLGGYQLRATYPSYRPSGKHFNLRERHIPDGVRVDLALPRPKISCVVGVVTDEKTGEPVPQAKVVVTDTLDFAIDSFQVKSDGSYRICLPYDHYRFNTTATGYFFNTSSLEVHPVEPGKDIRHDIQLKPLEIDSLIELAIYYDVDKWALRPESVVELNRVVKIMRQNSTLKVEIGGHTDSDASNEHNLTLSQNRAQSAVDFLLQRGISTDRMVAKGYGEESPKVPNTSSDNKQINRRTELKVIDF